jgi:hypothetical protein
MAHPDVRVALYFGRLIYVIGVLIGMGLLAFLIGWCPTIRYMFAEDRGIGYMAMLAPVALRWAFRSDFTGLLFPVITVPYCWIHRDDLRREMWFQIAGTVLFGIGIGLRRHLGI